MVSERKSCVAFAGANWTTCGSIGTAPTAEREWTVNDMPRKIPVVLINPDGTRTRYPSITEAAEANHTCVSQVYRAVNFGQKVHGMMWEKDGDGK